MTVVRSDSEFARWSVATRAKGWPQELSAKPWKPTRTNEQNAYLFGVCYPPIAEAMGYTVEDIHEYMLGRHFGWVDKPCPKTPRNPEGQQSVPYRTTTRDHEGKRAVLTKQEFAAFVETVQQVAAHAGVFIPDPEAK